MTIPVCVAVVAYNNEGKVAASARRHNHESWGLPGGKVEPGDGDAVVDLESTLRRAACRELLEETGLVAEPGSLDFIYAGVCKDESGGGNPDSITMVYEVLEFSGELRSGDVPAKWAEWQDDLLDGGSFVTFNQAIYDASVAM